MTGKERETWTQHSKHSVRVTDYAVVTLSLFSTRGMFAGGLREMQQKEIPIHGVSYMSMKKILDYIYTAEIELDLECVQEVLIAATLVQVGSLLASLLS